MAERECASGYSRDTGGIPPTATLPHMSTSPEATQPVEMTFASIDDIAVSWDVYERFLARLSASPPRGSVLQLAGPTEEGVRVIGVWQTEQDFESFRLDRLAPALEAVEGPVAPVWATRRLHVIRVAIGMASPDVSQRSTLHVEP